MLDVRHAGLSVIARYKAINYRVIGTVPGVLLQDLYYAVSQAFSIWGAHIPVAFIRKTTVTPGDVHISFVPDAPGGALGNALIEIDTTENFFIDKYSTPDDARWGPFDLIAAIAHEIGHNILNAYHSTTPGSILRESFGEGQVKRDLHAEDIALAQSKFGTLPTPAIINMRLQTASQINYAPDVVFQPSDTMISISGTARTTSVFQVYSTEVKNKKVNAINLSLKLHSKHAIINKVEVWDAIILHENHVLSFSSYQDGPVDIDIKVGLSAKPVFKYGLLFRIEVLFINESRVDVNAIGIETIPKPLSGHVVTRELDNS